MPSSIHQRSLHAQRYHLGGVSLAASSCATQNTEHDLLWTLGVSFNQYQVAPKQAVLSVTLATMTLETINTLF